jgi:hypothetical protein
MSRDYASEDASRTRTRVVLRVDEDEREGLEKVAAQLSATTHTAAVLGALAAVRALLAGSSAPVALARAREVAATPPPPRGWTPGKPRGPRKK